MGDAQHRRDRVGHRYRIGDRGQFEKPDPVGELVGETRCDFQRQTGFAEPARPGQHNQADEPTTAACSSAILGLTPDEARGRSPQVARTRIQRPQGREFRG